MKKIIVLLGDDKEGIEWFLNTKKYEFYGGIYPESRLHPIEFENFVKETIEYSKKDDKPIFIATRSDFIIKWLNIAIMLGGNLDKPHCKDLMQRFGWKVEQVIAPEEVLVYLFHQSDIISVKVDAQGFNDSLLDECIDDIEHKAEAIYFNLFER